jgi:hypothetical protein
MKKTLYSIMALAATVIGFTACEDVPEPYTMPVAKNIIEGIGDEGEETPLTSAGTAESPYIVTDILTVAKKMSADEQKENVYVKGIVSQINEISTDYGNATYFISIDGTQANQFEIFRGFGLNGDKFTAENQIKLGDVVVVCGTLVNFRGNTPELTTGSKIISINDPNVDPAKGDGAGEGEGEQAEGTYLDETFATGFGSFTVKTVKGTPWIIDFSTAKATGYDGGSKTTTPSESYLVSKAIDLSASKGATLSFEYILRYVRAGETENKVLITDNYTGDPTTTTWTDITGTLTEGSDWKTFAKYSQALPEAFIGKAAVVIALYYSCNNTSSTIEVKNLKLTEGAGNIDPDEPEPPTPTEGTYIEESFATSFGSFTVNTPQGTPWIIDFSTAKATGYDGGSKTTTPSESYLISQAIDLSASKGATLSFEYILRYVRAGETEDKVLITDNYTGDPTTTTWTDITGTLTEGSNWNTFYEYSQALPEAFIGKAAVVIALYYSCSNTSATFEVKNLKLVEGAEQGGGEGGGDTPQPGGDGIGTLSDNVLTVAASDFGLSNAAEVSSYNLTGGATVTFSAGSGTNTPKYYSAGNGTVRMYGGNTMAINAGSKTIASIKLVCNNFNGSLYNASGDVYVGEVQATIDGDNLLFNDLNVSSATVSNTSTGTGSAGQVRWEQLIITFAE